MIHLAVAIILFIGVLIWDLATDYRKWLNRIPVNHTLEGVVRAVLLIPSLVFFLIYRDPFTWWLVPVTVVMVQFWYWLLFDGIYNRLRGYSWWFTGSNDPDDARTDDFLQAIPQWLQIVIKLAGAAGGTILYVI